MATKILVPRASGEGGMGVVDNAWGHAYFDSGNFKTGDFSDSIMISGLPLDQAISQGGLGGKWNDGTNAGDIYYNGGNVGIGTTSPDAKLTTLIENDSTYGNVAPNSVNSVLTLINNPTSEAVNNHATLQLNLNAGTYNHVGSISLISESSTLRRGALAFCTDNGTTRPEAMRITANGKVGIGTVSPSDTLAIQDSSHGGTIQIGSANGSNQYQYINFADNWQIGKNVSTANSIGQAESLYIYNLVNSKTDLSITSSGDVGIGHTNPGGKLHVSDVSEALSGTVTVVAGSTNVTGNGTFFNTELSAGDRIKIGSEILTVDSITSDISLTLTAAHTAGTSSATTAYTDTNALIVTSAGNVGIGTSNSASYARLTLHDSQYPSMVLDHNQAIGGGAIRFHKQGASHGVVGSSGWVEGDSSSDMALKSDAGFGIRLYTNGAYERMRITSTGDVGIGTTNPGTNKLHVNGKTSIGDGQDNPPASPLVRIKGSGYSGQFTADGTAFYMGQSSLSRDLRLWSGDISTGVKLAPNSNTWVSVTSDRRAKENISPLENVLEKVLKLSPSRFDFKEKYGNKDQIGFIAQDVNEVLPEFHIPGKTEEEMSTVKFSDTATTALLVKAIQEQQQLIEDLKSRIKTLENK